MNSRRLNSVLKAVSYYRSMKNIYFN